MSNKFFSNWLAEQRENFSPSHSQATVKQSSMGGLPSDLQMAIQQNPSESSLQRSTKNSKKPKRSKISRKDEVEGERKLDLTNRGAYSGEEKVRYILAFEDAPYKSKYTYVAPMRIIGHEYDFLYVTLRKKPIHKGKDTLRIAEIFLKLGDGRFIRLWMGSSKKSYAMALCKMLGKGQNPSPDFARNDFFYHKGSASWWTLFDLMAGVTFTFPQNTSQSLPKNGSYQVVSSDIGHYFFEDSKVLKKYHVTVDKKNPGFSNNPFFVDLAWEKTGKQKFIEELY